MRMAGVQHKHTHMRGELNTCLLHETKLQLVNRPNKQLLNSAQRAQANSHTPSSTHIWTNPPLSWSALKLYVLLPIVWFPQKTCKSFKYKYGHCYMATQTILCINLKENLLLAEPNQKPATSNLLKKYRWTRAPSNVIWITHKAAGDNTQRTAANNLS